jgi:hypothetical protein
VSNCRFDTFDSTPVELAPIYLDSTAYRHLVAALLWPPHCAYPSEGNPVLKITTIESESQRRLVLEGKLAGPWVAELKKVWLEAKQSPNGHELVIDLCNVTVITLQAESVLLEIKRAGARFVCGGILNKHVLRRIERACECDY